MTYYSRMRCHRKVHRWARAGRALLMVPLAACHGSIFDAQLVPCGHASEFGSVGCAVVEVLIDEPDDLSKRWLLKVSARWPGGGVLAHAAEPRFGSFTMHLDLPEATSPVAGGDTASVWMVARLVDVEESLDGTTDYLARDSVLSVLRFARVGETPALESVRLTLK